MSRTIDTCRLTLTYIQPTVNDRVNDTSFRLNLGTTVRWAKCQHQQANMLTCSHAHNDKFNILMFTKFNVHHAHLVLGVAWPTHLGVTSHGFTRVIKIHLLGIINVWTKFHHSASNSCWDFSVWPKWWINQSNYNPHATGMGWKQFIPSTELSYTSRYKGQCIDVGSHLHLFSLKATTAVRPTILGLNRKYSSVISCQCKSNIQFTRIKTGFQKVL